MAPDLSRRELPHGSGGAGLRCSPDGVPGTRLPRRRRGPRRRRVRAAAARRRWRHRPALAAGARRLPLRLVRLAQRPSRRRPPDAGRTRRHGGVCGARRARPADPQSRDRRRPGRLRGGAGVRPLRRRRHDYPRLRPGHGRRREGVGQPVRHLAQLRGRADAVGVVADLRGDAGRAAAGQPLQQAARLRLRGALGRHGHRLAAQRTGPVRARGGSHRPGDRHRVPHRRPLRGRLLPVRAEDARRACRGRTAGDAGRGRHGRATTRGRASGRAGRCR